MKKSLIAAAAMTVVGVASAQSSVTVYGVLDAAISYYRGEGSDSKTLMTTSGYNNSRLGFRGREDLGGGMSASFVLEAGINNDTGAGQSTNTNNQPSGNTAAGGLTFNRQSTVSLSGPFGEIRLGRDYTPSFWNLLQYDPFKVGVGIGTMPVQGSTSTVFRASNSVGYFTPGCAVAACKGLYGQVMYAMGENPSGTATSSDGRYVGARIGYGSGPFDIAFGTGVTKNAAANDFTQTNLGASYDFGVAQVMGQWGIHKTGAPIAALARGTKATHYTLGARIPLGSGFIPVSYSHVSRNDANNGAASKVAIGYVYNLSKRTALYTNYANISNKNGMTLGVNGGLNAGPNPVANGVASGIDLGITHRF
ncbi:MAG: porin [Polaromonas sp.]